ncbi:GFA family protein [Litorivivens sp.]|uniref:GFA family protein n=1 Tax=Litorivivens sp. TaxID=2020868 RepID=UPI003569AA33
MDNKITGGCHCGQFRYETSSELIAPHYCHCGDCRKLYGTVGAGFIVLEDQTTVSGDIAVYESVGDSGNCKKHLFCPVCGTPIGERVDAFPGTLVFTPGTLDEPARFKPEAHFWVSRKAPYTNLNDTLTKLDTQPEG